MNTEEYTCTSQHHLNTSHIYSFLLNGPQFYFLSGRYKGEKKDFLGSHFLLLETKDGDMFVNTQSIISFVKHKEGQTLPVENPQNLFFDTPKG